MVFEDIEDITWGFNPNIYWIWDMVRKDTASVNIYTRFPWALAVGEIYPLNICLRIIDFLPHIAFHGHDGA